MQRESRIAHYVVGTLTALSLVLLSLPLSSPVRAFKACASYVFDPISYQGEKGSQRLAEAPSRVRELLSADIENRRLQEELRRMSWLRSTVDGLSLENDRLRRARDGEVPRGAGQYSGPAPRLRHVLPVPLVSSSALPGSGRRRSARTSR